VKGYFRRFLTASLLCLGLIALAASPALAQVERVYTGVTPPSVGNVLSITGERPATGNVLPLQVSSGVVPGAPQASTRGLAFTGADVVSLVVLALVAMTVGVVLTRRGRPRTTD
jgi:hypothetical protein